MPTCPIIAEAPKSTPDYKSQDPFPNNRPYHPQLDNGPKGAYEASYNAQNLRARLGRFCYCLFTFKFLFFYNFYNYSFSNCFVLVVVLFLCFFCSNLIALI